MNRCKKKSTKSVKTHRTKQVDLEVRQRQVFPGRLQMYRKLLSNCPHRPCCKIFDISNWIPIPNPRAILQPSQVRIAKRLGTSHVRIRYRATYLNNKSNLAVISHRGNPIQMLS
ncbi:uncharacterized protein SPPG_09482 [Spizellomyces punctatus DAOM BR117]|uniref:Uncharacterized protein n=1 Tax=Spizellomyces punctatus (strain DAOM BR117) TaxID=645134 RepID=A0A0L0H6U9_SPIPD|nr:uncharacterized protein SPPG_09482 [Spizellomyces punctatus DAOM BR117]KNC97235.1 hypothetical protein SPPG_09482 [Spizellomyces punctatus DAOM BR117]|eukprot:XP_016605275.1 hypothetical protein SPPG_09482 [Spizellomyces punctatus DAOM BR117]